MKPLELVQHFALFVLLVLLVSVVYNGLRRENVKEIILLGLRRGFAFVGVSALIFGLGGFLLAAIL